MLHDDADLVDDWVLLPDERKLLDGKWGHTRLGFALLLKAFQLDGCFASGADRFSPEIIEFVGRQVDVGADLVDRYRWSGRTNARDRVAIRKFSGFREFTVGDADEVTSWLAAGVALRERSPERVEAELVGYCRAGRIELPTPARAGRIVRSALARSEQVLTDLVTVRLAPAVRHALDGLIAVDELDSADDGALLGSLKSSPGSVGLESMLAEIDKLRTLRAIGVADDVFAGIAPKVVEGWRARAGIESPSHLRRHRPELRLTLLAALVHVRAREITDTLVELFLSTVHRINARAERKVTSELVNEFKRVTGKENILFSIAAAALDEPDAAVRDVVFPAVRGGEATLRDLVREYRASGPAYRRIVQTKLRASYTNHYRKGLIALLDVLVFDSNNAAHRPVLDAISLVRRHGAGRLRYFPADEDVPTHRGIVGDWETLVFTADDEARVVRAVYEICTFQALRDQLRCKEIWVRGADRWRNPDEDLPADFDDRRVEHYDALRQPLDPTGFIERLRDELDDALTNLDAGYNAADWLEIAERGRRGAIRLTPLTAVEEPANLRRLKATIRQRWGVVPMIDVLKEAVLRTGCLARVTSVGTRDVLSADQLAERLLLALYAYGTNIGIRAVAAGDHGHSEHDLRYVRRRYLDADIARALAIEIANATFDIRRPDIWGEGTSTVASDSTHFGSLDQNLFTEWHARYRGPGVMIYWHVERRSVAVHSQLISCSASEVAAMIEGAIRHDTTMTVEANYVDSHGQSEIGFGITRLLGFDLLPRIKRINHARLYRPRAGDPHAYPNLDPALTRPIRWDLIAEQYDPMIRYATAIRTGTASTEAILRRFVRANAQHPAYQAIIEVGRAQKTIFLARYLADRTLQREVNDGLNVIESWNRGNSILFYGKGGDIASNRRDEQELSVLCLRVLQAAVVYVNTLMIQNLLAEPDQLEQLTAADQRGLTPLFWTHIAPYGEVRLNMHHRLNLAS